MKKFLKWLAIAVAAILVIVAIAAFVMVSKINSRMEKKYEIAVEALSIPSDSLSIEKGKQWLPLCQHCHGEALQGKIFFDDPNIGTIHSANLTGGNGGIGKLYNDVDWIRAIRHGINKDGRALFIMPSNEMHHMSSADLSNLIAYLKNIPPVDNPKVENRIPIITKVLMQAGAFGDIFAAEVIDHKAAFALAPDRAPTSAYGEYLINVFGCKTCHAENLGGGESQDPNSPPAPNISSSGALGKWSDQEFIKTLRTGTTPDSRKLNDTFMPWKHIGQMHDGDLTAIYKRLKEVKGEALTRN